MAWVEEKVAGRRLLHHTAEIEHDDPVAERANSAEIVRNEQHGKAAFGTKIAQKREALENVLIPYRLDENVALMKEAGFHQPEIFFKWYNFSGLVAVK